MNQHYWDPPDTGNPLVDAVLVAAVIIVVTVSLLVFFGWRFGINPIRKDLVMTRLEVDRARQEAKKAKENSAVTREHTENQHIDAPNPNLRDNIDANQTEIRTALSAIMQTLDSIQQDQQEKGRDIGGLREEIRYDRQALRATADALAQHIRDKADVEQRLHAVETHQSTYCSSKFNRREGNDVPN